jgi:hypothetical protein
MGRPPAASAGVTRRGGGTTAPAAPLENRIRGQRRETRVGRDQDSALTGHPQVREEFPDHRGIVQRGDQPQPTPALRARQNINRERAVQRAAQLQAREPLFACTPSEPAVPVKNSICLLT